MTQEKQDLSQETDLLGSIPPKAGYLSYDDFKTKVATGEIAFFVDKGMAVMAARSGFSAGGLEPFIGLVFTLSLLMVIPAIFIWGLWAALCFLIGAFFAFRLTRYLLVQRVRKAVMDDEKWYKLFLEKQVIHLCKPNGEFL